jgi:hypothetical protein
MRPPNFIKIPKLFQIAQKWTLNFLLFGLLAATPPQFFRARVQEYRRNASRFDQPRIVLLYKSTTSDGNDSLRAGLQLLQQLFQSRMLRPAERRLSGIPEDFMHFPILTKLNSLVEVLKRPTQLFC